MHLADHACCVLVNLSGAYHSNGSVLHEILQDQDLKQDLTCVFCSVLALAVSAAAAAASGIKHVSAVVCVRFLHEYRNTSNPMLYGPDLLASLECPIQEAHPLGQVS